MKTKGFTLIELLLYISGLLILGTILVSMIIQFYGIYKEIVAIPRADRTGLLVVDRITKEIRSAKSINMLDSKFATTTGAIVLDVVEEGSSVEKKFYVQNGKIFYQKDSEEQESLSSSDFTVSNFNFTLVQTPISEAVRFTMEIQFKTRDDVQTKSYSGFAILRESYE